MGTVYTSRGRRLGILYTLRMRYYLWLLQYLKMCCIRTHLGLVTRCLCTCRTWSHGGRERGKNSWNSHNPGGNRTRWCSQDCTKCTLTVTDKVIAELLATLQNLWGRAKVSFVTATSRPGWLEWGSHVRFISSNEHFGLDKVQPFLTLASPALITERGSGPDFPHRSCLSAQPSSTGLREDFSTQAGVPDTEVWQNPKVILELLYTWMVKSLYWKVI